MSTLVFTQLPTNKKDLEISIGRIEVEVTFPDGKPFVGAKYSLKLSAGGTRTGVLDAKGKAVVTNVPKGATGEFSVEGAPLIAKVEG